MKFVNTTILGLTFMLGGCAASSIEDYRDKQPAFDPSVFFASHTDAWGMFQKRSGEVVRRFKVSMEGAWQGKEFVLDESFTYDDGETQHRQWHLTRTENGAWHGRAADIVGDAEGHQAGYALEWQYVMTVPVGTSKYDFTFDDWSYLVDEKHAVNRASMKKLGVEVGEVTLFFSKG
jgi:hypothetical protein